MALRGTRDLKYMPACLVQAQLFSTCSKRQVFAMIVSPQGKVVGTGYNGSPPGMPHCNEGHCPRAQQGSAAGSVYDNCIGIHGEQNAIMWSDPNARVGGTIYITAPPCMTCARMIAGSGVSRVVYLPDENMDGWPDVEAFLMKKGIELTAMSKKRCLERVEEVAEFILG